MGIIAGVFVLSFSAGIQHKYSNWKAFLVKRLTGAKTLPPDFSTKVGLKTRKINVAGVKQGCCNVRLRVFYAAADTQEPLKVCEVMKKSTWDTI